MIPLIYLSGAIEYSVDKGKGWRIEITFPLREMGYRVVNPVDFNNVLVPPPDIWEAKVKDPKTHDAFLEQVATLELEWASKCDVLLAKVDQATLRGCGTYCEIAVAFYQNKEIILWLDGVSRQEVPGFLFGLYNYLVYSREEALNVSKHVWDKLGG